MKQQLWHVYLKQNKLLLGTDLFPLIEISPLSARYFNRNHSIGIKIMFTVECLCQENRSN